MKHMQTVYHEGLELYVVLECDICGKRITGKNKTDKQWDIATKHFDESECKVPEKTLTP